MRPLRASALLVACAAGVAAIVSGCGGGGGGGNVDVGPAAAVPAKAPFYIEGNVRPTGAAEAQAKEAAGKILDTTDPGGKIISLIKRETKANGHPINYQQDVAPWLGEDAGLFTNSLGSDSQATVVFETTDPNAALAFARKAAGATATNPAPQPYHGASFQADPSAPRNVFGLVGNFLVEGDQAGFKAAVDASDGESLGDSSDFKDAIADLPADRLGTFYTLPKDLLEALPESQLGPSGQALLQQSAGDSLEKPVSGALTASADSIDLEFVGGANGVETPQSPLISEVPAQSWLALGFSDLGATVKRALDQYRNTIPNVEVVISQIEATTGATIEELTAALGDAAVYVEGTTQSTLTGALVVQTKDPDLTGRLLTQLRALLQFRGGVAPLKLSGGGSGFQINDPSLAPAPVEIAQQGDRLVIGYGKGSAERTLTPAQKLDGSPAFSAGQRQVSSLGTDFFLSFPAVFKLAESGGAKQDPGYVRAKPYLDALDYLVSGSGTKNDQAEVRAVLGLK